MKILPLIILLFIHTCDGDKNHDIIKGVEIENKFPIFHKVGDKWVVQRYDPFTMNIYYSGSCTLVVGGTYKRNIKKINGVISEESEFKYEKYLVLLKTGSSTCVYCDSLDITRCKIVEKDSILPSQWGLKTNFDKTFDDFNCAFTSTETIGDIVVDKYKIKNKSDSSIMGTLVLTFSNDPKKNFIYSLAPKLEKEKRMSLIRILTKLEGKLLPEEKSYMEGFEMLYEMREANSISQTDLQSYFRLDSLIKR